MLAACAVSGALLACSSAPHLRSDANVGGALTPGAGNLILVLLDNSRTALRAEAGSTPHGYDRDGAYAIGDRARATAAQLARSYHLTKLREWPIQPLEVDCLVFGLPPGAHRAEYLQRMVHDRRVRLAEPLQQFSTLAQPPAQQPAIARAERAEPATPYNDPYYRLQWGLDAMHVAAAQRWSLGQGVSIAVIDTGADLGHPDLNGRIVAARNFIDRDDHAFSSDRHGTLVAGLIAAVANNGLGIVGVAPLARLQVFKACEPAGPGSLAARCNSFTLALALSAAIEAHAQIVNLSLGGPADPVLAQLIGQGERDGMLFVGAVPPDGALDGFPLGVPGVVAAEESDRRPGVRNVLPAPGRDVLSLTPSGHYDFASGSSLSAAQISGALALLRAGAPHARNDQLINALQRSVMASPAHGQIIDLCAALATLQPQDHCTPVDPDRLARQSHH
jgi:subtilisin family serine protease